MAYAKLISSTQIDTNAPRKATINGRLVVGDLPEAYLNSQGFYVLDDSATEPTASEEGYHTEKRYAYDDAEAPTKVVVSWVEVEDPPEPEQVDMKSVRNFEQLKKIVASLVGSAMALLLSVLPAGAQTMFGHIDETNLVYTAAETDAAITNYYGLSALGRMYIDTNGVLAVDVRKTTTNDWSRAWDSAALKAALDANTEQMRQVEQALAHAVAAWASFDALGHPNPDDDTIMLNRAYAAIGSGFFWASSGGYYCLCSEGAVAYLATTNGSFRIFGNSISNYVGLIAAGTVTVGANASGFLVRDGVVSITYPYTGGDYPAVWGAATVAGPWTEMTSAVWVTDSGAMTATASFPADQSSFFFKATTTRELSEFFHATVPSYFQGGVKTSDDDLSPIVYDSKITITSGGHTYRIPAELVQ